MHLDRVHFRGQGCAVMLTKSSSGRLPFVQLAAGDTRVACRRKAELDAAQMASGQV